jgi:hypothetical protein
LDFHGVDSEEKQSARNPCKALQELLKSLQDGLKKTGVFLQGFCSG